MRGMSLPRRSLPGQTYLVTRRCQDRRFRLKPCRETNEAVRFCFALAASRAGVVLYGLVAMSDHYHAVAWDPEGRISVFLEVLNRLLAKLLNASQGRWGVVHA
jgi:REP element-mobilizing transposase RayT